MLLFFLNTQIVPNVIIRSFFKKSFFKVLSFIKGYFSIEENHQLIHLKNSKKNVLSIYHVSGAFLGVGTILMNNRVPTIMGLTLQFLETNNRQRVNYEIYQMVVSAQKKKKAV